MTQTARFSASMIIDKLSTPDGGQGKIEQVLSMLAALATGTANGQADIGYIKLARSLASNTTSDIDLSGSLTDAMNQSIACVDLVGIAIENPVANTTNLTIGNGTNPAQVFFGATTHSLILKPGDWFMAYSYTGWGVTAATADIIKVANAAGATNLHNVGFVGRSA